MNVDQIFDKIHVYSGLFDSPKDIAEKVFTLGESSFEGIIYKNWRDWYSFGRICDADGQVVGDENLYAEARLRFSENDGFFLDAEYTIFQQLALATSQCFKHYISQYNLIVPEPNYISNPNIAWYYPNIDTDGYGHTMKLHTDYAIGEWWWPGEKFLLTCTIYINDDYEGGEIVFFANGDFISYKPVAGDVLIFPSGNPRFPGGSPYYHGVNKTSNGRKILIRCYLKYWEYNNLFFWMSCKNRYGAEVWNKMVSENARAKNMADWPSAQTANSLSDLSTSAPDLLRNLYP